MTKQVSFFLICILSALFISCGSAKNVSVNYYFKNEKTLNKIEGLYKELYSKKPFALQFVDRKFEDVSIDILTDSIKFIYVFNLREEQRLGDTLKKYGLDIKGMNSLIKEMKSIKSTWINSLDYFTGMRERYMTFMAIRRRTLTIPFVPARYYILAYFNRPQYFDNEGRLLDGRRLKRFRKINGDIFRRINDSVCYTVSKSFR